MARHILLSLTVIYIVLLGSSSPKELSANTQLAPSLFQNNFAFKFFMLANGYFNEVTNSTTRIYDTDTCQNDLARISKGLSEYQEWAIEFPDTWGRMPMGLMWGHTISMGQFEECIAASRNFTGSSDMQEDLLKGQYCLAKVPIKGFMDKIVPRTAGDGHDKARISYKQTTPEFFELGMCIPSSCSPEVANQILNYVFRTFVSGSIDVSANMIRDGYCKVDEPIQLRAIDIFAICFFSFILCCLLASSIYDYVQTQRGEPKNSLFVSFSVLTNAPKVFSAKKINNPNVIPCLNGLRCFSMLWVVFGHGYMTLYDLPHINRNKFYTWVETPYSMLVQNATLCVDTFFFMSGLLMLWGAFREMEKTKGKLNIPLMYFHRYIRLTPVLAVVILYIMSLYKYSGAGPMWMKLGTQDQRCEDTWWATLLYVQNYVFPYKICVSQSWYLAVDTQLYFLSPLFLIPMWKWGKKAIIPISIFGFLCLVCTFATFMYNEFTLFRVQDDHVDERQRLTYYPTHTRIPTWLIGVLFGYFLFKYNRGKQIPLARHWVLLGWLVAFSTMLADLWGPYWRIRPENPDSPIIEGAFYEPLSRSSWAIAIGWIVWACYNGHGGIINDFLSWGFFAAFGRLTYCMYVIHRIVQWVNAGRLQTDTHFSDYDAVLRWWPDFGITLLASIVATLAFESPILHIEKALFKRGDSKSARKVEPTRPSTPTIIMEATMPEEPNKV